MAKYFKFREPGELEREAQRLGVGLRLTSDLSSLWTPYDICGRRVGNRLAYQPMEGCDATLEGRPDALTFRRWERFGAGGGKLVWGEAAAVRIDGQANPRQLVVSEANLSAIAQLVEACRRAHRQSVGDDGDLLIGLQLTHSGRFAWRRPVRAMACPLLDGTADGASVELASDGDLERLADDFVAAARLVAKAGFDFVDIKQCHRYLLSELLAAKTRPGRFGGSLENRTRLALAILRRIRDEAPHLLLATRLNVYDGMAFTRGERGVGQPRAFTPPFRTGFGTDESNPLVPDLREPLEYLGWLRDAGVALVNVSMGCPYFNPHLLRPAEFPPIDGYEAPEPPLVGVGRHFHLTEAVQRHYPDLAIVGSGYSYLQEFLYQAGAYNVAERRTTFVGLGRAALAYPHGPLDLGRHGSLDRKSICRTFSYCTNLMRNKRHPLGQFPTGCPPFDKPVYGPIWREAQEALQDPPASD